ncbi:DUF4238 domain-containing protein [Paraburkholderia saeva]|uniref:DUF4238 domain-containing protein n=1 Tax=Paraburkholderia saeva TaxID=2777537 RepID=A0A9N8RVC3_9BURK|nr:DUF4238 domain-containing protein [Paraburkholderia saeva]CAG4892216.1 hypothetical protein LMG31841_01575 [Paraburkholderia saeva]
MARHVYHHYVPRFLLEGWSTSHQLTRFQWVRGTLEVRKVGTKRIAGREHLYALHHVPDDPQFVEREFMGPLIDDPAARVYRRMLASRDALSDNQRSVWTRFLMSLRVRAPDVIDRLRDDAADELTRRLVEQPDGYDALRGSGDPATLFDFMETHRPGFIADFGIRMLPDLMNHAPIAQKIFQMYWWTQRFDAATVDLLTCDRPLIITPALNDPGCILALPLTPRLAFFATHTLDVAKRVGSTPASRLARALNQDTVRVADRQVYGANDRQAEFVRRHFRRPAADV